MSIPLYSTERAGKMELPATPRIIPMHTSPAQRAGGKSAAVNPFLRFDGKVRNLELPKKDIEQMIVHIWATREEVTTKLKTTPTLAAPHLYSCYGWLEPPYDARTQSIRRPFDAAHPMQSVRRCAHTCSPTSSTF